MSRRVPLAVREVAGPAALDAAVLAACEESLTQEGSIGLIAADARIPALAEALTAAGHAYLSPARRRRPSPG